MKARVYIASAICLTTVLLHPLGAEADQDVDTGSSPFAVVPLPPSELSNMNATGSATAATMGDVHGSQELAVILWDEAVPPRSLAPARRPGKRTEIRQGGRLLMTTATLPR